MSRIRLLTYRKGSRSFASLYQSIEHEGVKALRLEGSKFIPRKGDLIINWGNSSENFDWDVDGVHYLNRPSVVKDVTNKLNFFRRMSALEGDAPRIPPWTQDKAEALGWIQDGHKIFARTKLTGHSGEGIVVVENEDQLNNVKDNTLLVRYVKKREEYRVHFFKGEIFDIQRKAKINDRDDVNWLIRSHDNGFVYSRNNVGEVPEDVRTQALKAIPATGLDFGAIDVIFNKLHKQAWVLEVNTAPGLEGTTLTNYADKINQEIYRHVY